MVPQPPPPPGTRRARQKAETRALILDAARARFHAEGYDGTTMRAVAARAGVALGTIFKHFPDKGSLLIAAMLEDLDGLEVQLVAGLDPAAELDEQLRVFITAVYEFWAHRQHLARVLLREAWFLPGPAGEKYRAEVELLISRGADLLIAMQQRGDLRPDLDCHAVSKSLYGFYLLTMLQHADTPGYDPDAHGREMQRYFRQLLEGAGR